MAQYKTDFVEYVTGSQPSDWTERWGTANSSWSVEDEGIGSPSDNILRHTASVNARRMLSWDDIDADPNRDNVEILSKFKTSSTTNAQNHLRVRGSGSSGSETAYGFFMGLNSGTITVNKLVSGSGTTLGTDSFSWSTGTYFWVRFRVNGTSLKARIWEDGDIEPSTWNIEVSDSSISGVGWAGFGAFTSSGNRDFDFVSIATNGETAEGPGIGQAAAARVTQSAILALTEGESDTRVTQSAVLVMFSEVPPERITQAPVLALVQFDADTRISQVPVLALVDQVECLTRWAQAWRIERTDGEVFLFTDLDRVLTFKGESYQPCDSLNASATELATVLGSVGNQELSGIISDTGITEADLYNGLFDNAKVEIWSVPWENQGGEIPFRLLAGRLGDMSQGTLGFTAEILTPGGELQQRPLLRTYSPSCRWILGDENCTVDLDALEVSGSVTSTVIHTAPGNTSRRIFGDSSRTEDSGFFSQGTLTWTSGANNGRTSEIKDFDGTNFTLWETLLDTIQVGDTYTAKPGCDKTEQTCKDKFDNFVNNGSFPHVPGNDAIQETPDSNN